MDLQGQTSFTFTVKFMDHSCSVKNVQLSILCFLFFAKLSNVPVVLEVVSFHKSEI